MKHIHYILLSTCTELVAPAWSQFATANQQHQGHDDPTLFFASSHMMGVAINPHSKQAASRS
jgi:hypothetical protein